MDIKVLYFNLGLMYFNGQGVPQDYAQAAKWFRLAADQGNADAQFHLGLMYYFGEGVSQDDVEAAKWYRLAADQGHASAQFNLGVMYANGQGVRRNYVQAEKWYSLATDQGYADGAKLRDLAVKQMTPQQIAQAQELARNWKPKQ